MDRLDRIEKAIEELQKSQTKRDAQLEKTDAQLPKSDASWQETKKILSNVSINPGHVAEEFFYYALREEKKFGGIQFDEIELNVHGRNRKVQDEFDIVLYNGNSIAILEIKHKVHPLDLQKLKTRKIANFKSLFPDYADCQFYLGIGGMSIPSEVAEMAKAEGIAIQRQKGEVMEMEDESLKPFA